MNFFKDSGVSQNFGLRLHVAHLGEGIGEEFFIYRHGPSNIIYRLKTLLQTLSQSYSRSTLSHCKSKWSWVLSWNWLINRSDCPGCGQRLRWCLIHWLFDCLELTISGQLGQCLNLSSWFWHHRNHGSCLNLHTVLSCHNWLRFVLEVFGWKLNQISLWGALLLRGRWRDIDRRPELLWLLGTILRQSSCSRLLGHGERRECLLLWLRLLWQNRATRGLGQRVRGKSLSEVLTMVNHYNLLGK